MNDQTTSTPPDQDASVSAWLERFLADEARAIERLLDAVQKDAAVIDDLLAGLLDSDHTPMHDTNPHASRQNLDTSWMHGNLMDVLKVDNLMVVYNPHGDIG